MRNCRDDGSVVLSAGSRKGGPAAHGAQKGAAEQLS